MKHWEISGNLDDAQNGLANYPQFQQAICRVKKLFDDIFGTERLNSIDLFIDNATAGSGYTPITTTILGKFVVIKLGIAPDDRERKVAYQFAHELTHFVFRTYLGINKPHANAREETICSAAALITIKHLYPSHFNMCDEHVRGLSNTAYRNGAYLAESIGYDFQRLKGIIEEFHY